MKIIWQDIYTLSDTNLKKIKESFSTMGVAISWGEIVYEDKKRIVLMQTDVKGFETGGDYIIIPKSVIIRKEKG